MTEKWRKEESGGPEEEEGALMVCVAFRVGCWLLFSPSPTRPLASMDYGSLGASVARSAVGLGNAWVARPQGPKILPKPTPAWRHGGVLKATSGEPETGTVRRRCG